MTEERMPLAELLEKAGEANFLRAVAEAVLQLLMEADVEGLIGASRCERTGERTTWRGYRERALESRLGALQAAHPEIAEGSYFPPFVNGARIIPKRGGVKLPTSMHRRFEFRLASATVLGAAKGRALKRAPQAVDIP